MDDHKPTPFNWWFLSDWFAQKMPWSFRFRKYSKICTDILHSTWTNSISNMCLKSLCRDPFRFWWFLHHESLLVFITLTAPKVQPQAIGWTMGRREFHLQGGKTPMRRMMVVHGGEGDGVSVFVCFHGGGRFLWECCLCWWWQWSYCGGVFFFCWCWFRGSGVFGAGPSTPYLHTFAMAKLLCPCVNLPGFGRLVPFPCWKTKRWVIRTYNPSYPFIWPSTGIVTPLTTGFWAHLVPSWEHSMQYIERNISPDFSSAPLEDDVAASCFGWDLDSNIRTYFVELLQFFLLGVGLKDTTFCGKWSNTILSKLVLASSTTN